MGAAVAPQREAEDYMALTKRALGEKGLLGFGAGVNNVFNATGVTYGNAPQGSQSYSAGALIAR